MQTLPSVLIYSATFRRISLVTPGSMPAAAMAACAEASRSAPLPGAGLALRGRLHKRRTQDLIVLHARHQLRPHELELEVLRAVALGIRRRFAGGRLRRFPVRLLVGAAPSSSEKAVKRMRFVMPGSRNGPGYGSSEDGFTCKRSICVRLYSIFRYS